VLSVVLQRLDEFLTQFRNFVGITLGANFLSDYAPRPVRLWAIFSHCIPLQSLLEIETYKSGGLIPTVAGPEPKQSANIRRMPQTVVLYLIEQSAAVA